MAACLGCTLPRRVTEGARLESTAANSAFQGLCVTKGLESTQQTHMNGGGTHQREAVAEEQTQLQEGAPPHVAGELHHLAEPAESSTRAG